MADFGQMLPDAPNMVLFGQFDELTRALTAGAFVGLLAPVLLLALAIPYAVLRLRAGEGGEPDPQVGLKVFLYYFYSVSIVMMLTGFTLLAVNLVQEMDKDKEKEKEQPKQVAPPGGVVREERVKDKDDDFNPVQRRAAALILTGLFFGLFHWVLAKVVTNDRQFPAARRVFVGWRLAIAGLVLLGTATALMLQLFEKEPSAKELKDRNVETIKEILAVGFVWSIAWIIDLILLSVYSRTARRTSGSARRSLPAIDDDD